MYCTKGYREADPDDNGEKGESDDRLRAGLAAIRAIEPLVFRRAPRGRQHHEADGPEQREQTCAQQKHKHSISISEKARTGRFI